jgi:hypothetical protein
MQVAYDLVWHSVISFYFNGAFVRRGWAEAMVMGDSGQGKTEMFLGMLGHYRLGERVQGEQTSSAGLIGGLEKMGDTWLLSWGRIPLNDKRLHRDRRDAGPRDRADRGHERRPRDGHRRDREDPDRADQRPLPDRLAGQPEGRA